MNKKNRLKIILTLFSFLFIGCASTKAGGNVITFISENGQSNYIRQTQFKTNDNQIKNFIVDITYVTNNGSVYNNPIVNYTLSFSSNSFDLVDGTKVSINYNQQSFELSKENVLFKKMDNDGSLLLRYSSEIGREVFQNILKSNGDVTFTITNGTEKNLLLSSKEFTNKINEARIIF